MLRKNLEELGSLKVQELLDNSISIVKFLEEINCFDVGGNRKTLYRYIAENNLSLDKLEENRRNAMLNGDFSYNKIKDDNEIFCVNSKVTRRIVKPRILKRNLIPYKCNRCGNEGNWFGENLILVLDHINGVGNDNRIENLRFLCPNCHSQTETFAGKNYKSDLYKNDEYIEKRKLQHKKRNIKYIETKKKKKEEKLKLIEKRRKDLENIDVSKFGWIKKVQNLWGVSHSQVKRWIKKYYPDLEYFERN